MHFGPAQPYVAVVVAALSGKRLPVKPSGLLAWTDRGLIHISGADLMAGLAGLISEKLIRFDGQRGGGLLLDQLQTLRGSKPEDPAPKAWRKRERLGDLVTACSLGCWLLSRMPSKAHQPPAPRLPIEVRPPTFSEVLNGLGNASSGLTLISVKA